MSPELRQLVIDAACYFQNRVALEHQLLERNVDWYIRQFGPPRYEYFSQAYVIANAYSRNKRDSYHNYWICMCELMEIPIDIDVGDNNIAKVISLYCWIMENDQ